MKNTMIPDEMNIDFTSNFTVGICFGIYPDIVREQRETAYQEFTLMTFSLYDRISEIFQKKGIGCEMRRTARMLHMIGIFPIQNRSDFVSFYIEPIQVFLEQQYHTKIRIGIGLLAENDEYLNNSYRTAEYAYELFFFTPQPMIEFQKIHQDFTVTLEDYDQYVEDAFYSILMKKPDALDRIDQVVDVLRVVHYGNWRAVLMRIMNLAGELTGKLRHYKLYKGDFYQMQNELQDRILNSQTFIEAKQYFHEYYEHLLPTIYNNGRTGSKAVIEQVKRYIQDNFMNELSIKELSEVACVSQNYFSHMFKNEVGQNYKEYLTNIRLEKALNLLLNTDYKLYQISEMVGYNNMRTFVDAFKQKYHDSPTHYIKKLKKESGSED